MYRVPPARAWWPAVGAPLERGVRHQCARFEGKVAAHGAFCFPPSGAASAFAVLSACGAGHERNLLFLFILLDGFGLLLCWFGSPRRRKRRRETDEAKKDQDRKQEIEERLLPVDIHGPRELGLSSAISSGVSRHHVGGCESVQAGDLTVAALPPRGCLIHADRRISCWRSATWPF